MAVPLASALLDAFVGAMNLFVVVKQEDFGDVLLSILVEALCAMDDSALETFIARSAHLESWFGGQPPSLKATEIGPAGAGIMRSRYRELVDVFGIDDHV